MSVLSHREHINTHSHLIQTWTYTMKTPYQSTFNLVHMFLIYNYRQWVLQWYECWCVTLGCRCKYTWRFRWLIVVWEMRAIEGSSIVSAWIIDNSYDILIHLYKKITLKTIVILFLIWVLSFFKEIHFDVTFLFFYNITNAHLLRQLWCYCANVITYIRCYPWNVDVDIGLNGL